MARDLTAQINPTTRKACPERVQFRPLRQALRHAAEVASLVMWLLSDESEYVSGGLHLIDGALNAG